MVLRFLAAALLLFWPSLLTAQSLGDVARKESERRQAVKPSGRVITNKDLPTVSAPSPSAAPAPDGTGTPADAAPAAPQVAQTPVVDEDTGEPDKEKDREHVKDEGYWAGRMKTLRDELARDRIFADALQSRINALTTDFVNRDDPAQRQLIARDRQDAIDELARVQKSIVARGKAIGDLEEEARRAGVPPGWLRQ